MASFHFLDYCIVAAYLLLVTALGKVAQNRARSGEGFFLAGRKLGKGYQFFLNFGHSTDATGAVSTASIVYQQGVSGVWVGFQMIFLNPYYWFMYAWFRRVRLTTMADLFEDRLGSRGLAWFYAGFQIIMAVTVTMAFCNLVSFKISAALVTKAEIHWTAEERQSVEGYRELTALESRRTEASLPDEARSRLAVLQERPARARGVEELCHGTRALVVLHNLHTRHWRLYYNGRHGRQRPGGGGAGDINHCLFDYI